MSADRTPQWTSGTNIGEQLPVRDNELSADHDVAHSR